MLGYEVFLHLPMEAKKTKSGHNHDEGPNVIKVGYTAPEIYQIVHQSIRQIPGAVGLNNHMGSRLTASEPEMRAVMREIKRNDLMFVDSLTSGASVGERLAHEYDVDHIGRDIFIDHIDEPESIALELQKLLRTARKQGYAVAIAHPRAHTITALKQWIPTAKKLGYEFVPVSAVIKNKAPLLSPSIAQVSEN